MLQHKKPAPEVMIFTIQVDPSFVIIALYIVCLIYAQQQRRFLNKIKHFHFRRIVYSNYDQSLYQKMTPWGKVKATVKACGPRGIFFFLSWQIKLNVTSSGNNYVPTRIFLKHREDTDDVSTVLIRFLSQSCTCIIVTWKLKIKKKIQ